MIGAAQVFNKGAAAFALSGFAATFAVSSRQTAFAEEKATSFSDSHYLHFHRKPIYDDAPALVSPSPETTTPSVVPVPTTSSSSSSSPAPNSKSPKLEMLDSIPPVPSVSEVTTRLAEEIKHVRLGLYNAAAKAEDKTNEVVSRFFRLETRVSDRIAALAPSPGAKERVGSGLLTTVVAGMGASIFTRNRNILIRSTVPFVVALATANYVIPETMSNVNTLLLDIEGRVSPEVRRNHELAGDRISQFIATGKAHSRMGVDLLEQKIGDARLALAEWVRGRGR